MELNDLSKKEQFDVQANFQPGSFYTEQSNRNQLTSKTNPLRERPIRTVPFVTNVIVLMNVKTLQQSVGDGEGKGFYFD